MRSSFLYITLLKVTAGTCQVGKRTGRPLSLWDSYINSGCHRDLEPEVHSLQEDKPELSKWDHKPRLFAITT